ncbi:MAG: DUF2934 domain-containing protein [Gammaproteobacteria bacterium]|nr:DUF2934 domain-containing protein [Gammaproteobacteria bacterium]
MTSVKPRGKTVKATRQTTTTKPRATSRITKPNVEVDDDKRQQMIREAAYFKAMGREFANGSPEQDWIEAEQEINHLIGA